MSEQPEDAELIQKLNHACEIILTNKLVCIRSSPRGEIGVASNISTLALVCTLPYYTVTHNHMSGFQQEQPEEDSCYEYSRAPE